MLGHDGWIGSQGQLLHALHTASADVAQDGSGRILLYGECPSFFLGIEDPDGDVVVPAGCEYSVGGSRANVAMLLRSTSYGQGVTVI